MSGDPRNDKSDRHPPTAEYAVRMPGIHAQVYDVGVECVAVRLEIERWPKAADGYAQTITIGVANRAHVDAFLKDLIACLVTLRELGK